MAATNKAGKEANRLNQVSKLIKLKLLNNENILLLVFGLEKSKSTSKGRGTGRLQPAMKLARKGLVRGRGIGVSVKRDQHVGVQGLVEGNAIEMFAFYFLTYSCTFMV